MSSYRLKSWLKHAPPYTSGGRDTLTEHLSNGKLGLFGGTQLDQGVWMIGLMALSEVLEC